MRKLRTILIAPSRYDARGVVVFRIGISPNGALGALAGLAEDYNRRHAGPRRGSTTSSSTSTCARR